MRLILPLALIGVFLALYIVPLGVRPIVIPDEMRYAEIGREMVRSGDRIVPRLNGLRYFEKPIMGYWLHALSIKLLGTNAFAIRLPSVLAVGLSALMLFLLVRRFTGDASVAIIAASIFLTCLEIYGVGTFCVLDSIFSMFITASVIAFLFAFMEARPGKRTAFLIVSGVACGLAFLTKGFLAFMISAIIIIPFGIWQRRFRESVCQLLIVDVTATLIAFPWSIMVYLREPDFWHYFFWVEHVDRFISPNTSQHPNPFWYFIPFILGGTLPWTTQIIGVIYRLGKTQWKDPLLRFTICWFLFPFLFFSISRGKLGTYILPCFPPLIVLFAIGLRREFTTVAGKFSRSARVSAALIVALAVVLVLTQTIIPHTKIYRPNEAWKWLFLTIGLLTYGGLLIQAGRATSYTRKYAFSCLAPLLLMFSGQFAAPDRLMEKKSPTEFLERHKDKITQNTLLVSDNYLVSAICWSYERTDVSVLGRTGELAYGLGYDDSKHRLLDIDQFKELIRKSAGNECIALFTSPKRYAEYRQLLPEPVLEDLDGGFVFAEFGSGNARNVDMQDSSDLKLSQSYGLFIP